MLSMFCKHEWQLLSEIITKSKFEHIMDVLPAGQEKMRIPPQLCDGDRKHIQVFTCGKCGKLKRFVEVI